MISKSFASTTNTRGDRVRLTFTITNSADRASKMDMTFTDTLAAGLTAVAGTGTTTCGNGTVAVQPGSITVAGADLAVGQATCTVSVDVTSQGGNFTNGPANVTSNIDGPLTTTSVNFAAPTDGPETARTPYNTPVTLNPLNNFTPVAGDTNPTTAAPATFAFTAGPGIQVSGDGRTATTAGGTYVYNPTTGQVTFTPANGFIGTDLAVPYSYKDSNVRRPGSGAR